MAEYFDYKIITSSLIKAVRTLTNFPCIEANGTGDQPAYPFATFNIISPKITYERDNDNAQFEVVVSLTWHGESSLSVLNLAKKCESYFKASPGRDLFAEKNVVIVDVTDFNRRDNFISIEFERTAGFDISMRVMDSHADDIAGMEVIQIN